MCEEHYEVWKGREMVMAIGGIGSNQYTADMWAERKSSKASSNQFMQQMGAAAGGRPREYKVYMKTDDMLYSGGYGSGLSFYIKYAEDSTEQDPTVVARGVDENGREFEQTIHINDINPRCATVVEMHALEAYLGVDKNGGLSSLPKDPSMGNIGLYDRANFIELFQKSIRDMNTLGQKKLAAYYQYGMKMYQDFMKEKKKKGLPDFNAPFGYWEGNLRKVGAPNKEQEGKSESDIITNPDGSKTLMITKHIGNMESVMSVRISEPSDLQRDRSDAEILEAGKKAEVTGAEIDRLNKAADR